MAQVIANGSSLGPIRYCTPQRDVSNGLLRNLNEDHMQKLCPREVDIPTYHFEARITVGVSSSRVLFGVSFPLCFMLKMPLASL